MNSVALIGRLTANPIVHAGEQHASATFRLAIPRPGSDSADFVDIVTFDKLAETCADWLTKGREVAVAPPPLKPEVSAGIPEVGKLRLSEWTGRDGERRSKIQVVADAVQFLGKPTKAAELDGGVADEQPAERPRRANPRAGGISATGWPPDPLQRGACHGPSSTPPSSSPNASTSGSKAATFITEQASL